MYISRLTLGNFKRFEETSIDLSSKISVLVGPNSSGKSSIIKALLAMKQTASPTNENEALATQGEYVDLGVYKDYIFNHEIDRRLKIGLTMHGGVQSLPTAFQNPAAINFNVCLGHDHITEQARLFEINVSDANTNEPLFLIIKKVTRDSFLIRLPDGRAQALIKGFRNLPGNHETLTKIWTKGISLRVDDRYQLLADTDSIEESKSFEIQDFPIYIARSFIDAILRTLEKDFFYIGPLRRSPSRSYGRTGHLLSVGAAGEHTPSVLANLKARAAKERSAAAVQRGRLNQLQQWMEKLFPGRSVEAKSFDELVKLVISRTSSQGDAISDVGFGISQILPILVQIAVMPDDSTLMIEQPELHLHPSVQTSLAEIIASASLSGRRFIVETHSEHFVRGLQLAISNERAKKRNSTRLEAKDVKIIYVPAAPEDPEIMQINEWGEFIKEWPAGFFDEAYRLSMKLLENKMTALASQATIAPTQGRKA